MEIDIALNGSKRRDFELFAGDEVTITLSVYERDGDPLPINSARVTNISVTTAGFYTGTIPIGVQFTVSNEMGSRNWYTLSADIDGLRRTLAYGYILSKYTQGCGWGYPYPAIWDYGWYRGCGC